MLADKFDKRFELIIAILLGVTALLTAWASWQESLYGGDQATSYTKGTAMVSEANSMYNEAFTAYSNDMRVYDEINGLRIDLTIADERGDADEVERLEWRLDELMMNNVSEELEEAILWADEQTEATGEYYSPFDMEGFVDAYFTDYYAAYDEGQQMISDGQDANYKADVLGLSSVIYAVVLFLLGIVNTFDEKKIKIAITAVSCAALIFAVVTMFTIPFHPLQAS